jgi:hypothetical protein
VSKPLSASNSSVSNKIKGERHPSTVIAYEGASQLTGEPIVMLLTGLENPSSNLKTGQMVQAVVLDGSLKPTEAIKSGSDANVCGDCPLRRGICYLNLIPFNGVYKAYAEGRTPHITQEVLERAKAKQKRLRITAYGDPSAVPFEVWKNLLQYFTHWTGYSHQWRSLDSRWSKFLMASCETEEDVVKAARLGWSTFRVRTPESPMMTNEIQCPNVADPTIQCSNCRLCSGTRGERTRHISIEVHGLDWKVKNFGQLTTV